MPLMSARLAGAWSGCWPWPTIAAARQRRPHSLPTLLEAGTLPELEPLQAHLGPDPQSLPQLATLECELLDRRRFRSRDEARLGVFEFIEGFYNRHRRHSALGYQSPVAFEAARAGRSSVNAVTAPILALGALQGRDSPTVGGVRAVRRPSRPHSGPLRAFQTPRGTPGYPLKHPSKSAPSAVGPRVGHDIRRTSTKPGHSIDLPHPAFITPVRSTQTRDPTTAPSLRGRLTYRVLQVLRSLSRRARPQQLPVHQNGTTPDVSLGAPADYNDLLDHPAALTTPPGRTVRTRYVTVHSGHELARSSSSLDGYWIAADAAPSLIPNIHRKSHPPPRALPPFTAASFVWIFG